MVLAFPAQLSYSIWLLQTSSSIIDEFELHSFLLTVTYPSVCFYELSSTTLLLFL
eukprot:c22994_g1_i1 orf=79-243(+)